MKKKLLTLFFVAVTCVVLRAQTTLFTDHFVTNGANLGSNWTAGYTGDDAIQVVSQAANPINVGNVAAETVNSVSPNNDQFAQVTLTTYGSAEDDRTAILLRASAGPANTWYECATGVNGITAFSSRIAYRNAGTISNSSSNSTVTWTNGDLLSCQVVGTTITMKRNGSTTATLTDSNLVSGRFGLTMLAQTIGSNVADDFSGGNTASSTPVCGQLLLDGVGCDNNDHIDTPHYITPSLKW